jgi:hypothetical protein
MMASDFQQKLRKLNRKLHIYCGDDVTKPAGIYFVENGEYMDVCGIDKNWVPEYQERYADGRIKKGGWRRALRILIKRRLVDRFHAERVFSTHLEYSPNDKVKHFEDPIQKRRREAKQRSVEKLMNKTGIYNPYYMDEQELMGVIDLKKELKAKGEIR